MSFKGKLGDYHVGAREISSTNPTYIACLVTGTGSRYPELFLLADVKIQGPVLPDPDMATFSFRVNRDDSSRGMALSPPPFLLLLVALAPCVLHTSTPLGW